MTCVGDNDSEWRSIVCTWWYPLGLLAVREEKRCETIGRDEGSSASVVTVTVTIS